MALITNMEATLIDVMGTDNRVVDAARVSFNKPSWDYSDEQNAKLIRYLARHNHWTPFAHVQVSFHLKAPIFVARQMGKHQIGLVWNEVSRRYVCGECEFYLPQKLRLKAENVKQGSSEDTLDLADWRYAEAEHLVNAAANLYTQMINGGVCPEQARMFLPQNMMTEWYWTGSLMAFARVCKLRLDSHTQAETRELAAMMKEALDKQDQISVSWSSLVGGIND